MYPKIKRWLPQTYLVLITRRSMSVHWVACDTRYTKTEGTDLGGIELQRSSYFFKRGVFVTI